MGEDPTARFRRYLQEHAISRIQSGKGWYICQHDGIRLHRRVGGWYHDADEVRRLRATADAG